MKFESTKLSFTLYSIFKEYICIYKIKYITYKIIYEINQYTHSFQ